MNGFLVILLFTCLTSAAGEADLKDIRLTGGKQLIWFRMLNRHIFYGRRGEPVLSEEKPGIPRLRWWPYLSRN